MDGSFDVERGLRTARSCRSTSSISACPSDASLEPNSPQYIADAVA